MRSLVYLSGKGDNSVIPLLTGPIFGTLETGTGDHRSTQDDKHLACVGPTATKKRDDAMTRSDIARQVILHINTYYLSSQRIIGESHLNLH